MIFSATFILLHRVHGVAVHRTHKAASRGVTTVCYQSIWLREVLSCHRQGSGAASSRHPSPLSLSSDVQSTHEEEEALIDLLGADKIPLELSLVFLPPEIQCLYQAHQIARWEALSHSPEFTVGFALGTNGRERCNRYQTPTPYPRRHTRQGKVYVADEHKQRYKDAYDPDLDHYYDLYLRSCSYLHTLWSYPY